MFFELFLGVFVTTILTHLHPKYPIYSLLWAYFLGVSLVFLLNTPKSHVLKIPSWVF
jgi:hypothetical protein